MALSISTYTDPGVFVGETIVPGTVSPSSIPFTVCLVGIGSRDKYVSNEAVTRGLVVDEAKTPAVTPGAHDVTLTNIGNRQTSQTTVTKDGVALDSLNLVYPAATITGPIITTLNFTTNNIFSLSFDGKQPVTILLAADTGDSNVISGSLITQKQAGFTTAAATPAQLVAGINKAFAGAATLGYGAAYGAVATEVIVGSDHQIKLTSPISTSASDIRLFAAFPVATSETMAMFGVGAAIATPGRAATTVRITNTDYSATSTYLYTYVSASVTTDALLNASVQDITRVGNYAGVTSYVNGTDYIQATDTISWAATAATFTSSIASATFDIRTNDTIIVSLDGKAAVTIDINAMASPPLGYGVLSGSPPGSAATGAQIVANINAVLANTLQYGPLYAGVATYGSTLITLTSPTTGIGSIIEIGEPGSLSAVTTLFGLLTAQCPYDTFGVGARPSAGAVFFASYDYTRPTADYNLPKQYFAPDLLYADVGWPTATNQLAIAGSICFDNKAPSVMVVQVNDANFPGSPTITDFSNALVGAENTSVATDMIVLDTRLQVQTNLITHIEAMSSPTEKQYRRGWFGMATGTLIGDKDTPETYVYRAVRTLQVSADSPARGRMILVAPSGITRTVTQASGAQVDVVLNGTYVAAAIASKMTSFTSPSDTLLRKTITGFNIDTFPTYLKAERAILASNGVTVVTYSGGNLLLTDPITTEAAVGKLITFSEISASPQKDSVSTAVANIMDANLIGVVPSDLSSFILTIKGFLAGTINGLITSGAIGPYKNTSGITRDIDLTQDVQVYQDPQNPTQYYFRYWYNLRLPCKRMFGDYSVNAPFWQS
jgi:hypothetical protein